MTWVKINDDHLKSYADSIRYAKDGTEYTTTLERARSEITQDNEYFEDISEAVQRKTGQTEPYDKSELAGAIDAIVVDPNANLDAYIQGDLTTVTTNATKIMDSAFYHTIVQYINMPNVIEIGDDAFRSSVVNISELPSGLASLGNYCFQACPNLTISTFPNGITVIPLQSFYGCTGINNLVFPQNLTDIYGNSFNGCTNLITVDLSDVNGIINLRNTSAFGNTTCTFLFRDQTQLDAYATATNWSALADRFQIKGGGS